VSDVFIISGSSREEGSTLKTVELLLDENTAKHVCLIEKNIAYYDYQYKNQDDDFMSIVDNMIEAKRIVFATPVYWYAMSAPMKTFFDRLSDLLELDKERGRALKGRQVFLLANGKTDLTLPDGFEVPFARTSEYFDMDYKGKCFVKISDRNNVDFDNSDSLVEFRNKVFL